MPRRITTSSPATGNRRARTVAGPARQHRAGPASTTREPDRSWLVLCHTTDVSAVWAYRGLRARGLGPIDLVTAEVLSAAFGWQHRIGADGAGVEIALADGRVIRSDRLRGVINRIVSVPVTLWRHASEVNREYVVQELTALYVSWLYALPCVVLNRPTASGLAGAWRRESEWLRLATWAGLPTAAYRQSTDDSIDEKRGERRLLPAAMPTRTVIVAGGRAFATHAPAGVLNGCVRLAAISATPLLGVDFIVSPVTGWTFVGATPTPDLISGGAPLLDALADALAAASGAE
jgi:hypothetical protein